MSLSKVKVFAPATLANFGPGFDVLGLALEEFGDIVVAEKCQEPGIHFSLAPSSFETPKTSKNVAAHVADLLLRDTKSPFGIRLELLKQLPIGSGLGSSGASCAAAAYAVNALLPKPLAKSDLICFAMEGERLASGSAHADNVAPALLGGACLIRSYQPLDVVTIPIKHRLYWTIIHLQITIETASARQLLPTQIPLNTVVEQSGNLSGLIISLILGDDALLARSLHDKIAEPVRSNLIPNFFELQQAALKAGALGFSLSGSGPSLFAVSNTLETANRIANAFKALANAGDTIFISRLNLDGSKILESS